MHLLSVYHRFSLRLDDRAEMGKEIGDLKLAFTRARFGAGGQGSFNNFQRRPLHASEKDETRRQGSNSDHPEGRLYPMRRYTL